MAMVEFALEEEREREERTLDFKVDQVAGEGELVGVQQAVLVDVGQLPDLGQHRVGQLALHHVRLGHLA